VNSITAIAGLFGMPTDHQAPQEKTVLKNHSSITPGGVT